MNSAHGPRQLQSCGTRWFGSLLVARALSGTPALQRVLCFGAHRASLVVEVSTRRRCCALNAGFRSRKGVPSGAILAAHFVELWRWSAFVALESSRAVDAGKKVR